MSDDPAAKYYVPGHRNPNLEHAACIGVDVNIFYPTAPARHADGHYSDPYNEARAYCAACPVTAACLKLALDTHDPHGMWGGLSPRQRGFAGRIDRLIGRRRTA